MGFRNSIGKLLPTKSKPKVADLNLTLNVTGKRSKGEKITPQELRQLRELLRLRYALDLEIWGLRKVSYHNRPVVKEKMKQADALMTRIRAFITSIDKSSYFESDAEYAAFKQVKGRILEEGKRPWMLKPPWQDDE